MSPRPRHCARCDHTVWWHRSHPDAPNTVTLCADGHASPTFTRNDMVRVQEALTHMERLDLPSPYEELTLFNPDRYGAPLRADAEADLVWPR